MSNVTQHNVVDNSFSSSVSLSTLLTQVIYKVDLDEEFVKVFCLNTELLESCYLMITQFH